MNRIPQSDGRRNFIKKSLVTTVAAGQPLFLAGLIRAAAGGVAAAAGGIAAAVTTVATTEPPPPGKVTTDPYTTFPVTYVSDETTVPPDTTIDPNSVYTYL